MHPVAFVDDNIALHKNMVNGLTVFSTKEIEKVVSKLNIQEILLALPSASRSRIREIIAELEPLPVKLRTIPSFDELVKGKVKIEDIRDVNVDDLLGRDTVEPNNHLLCANVTNKVVMVTGAGGSIGSELCRQIVKLNPVALVLYEQSEYNLYALEKELINECSSNNAVFDCVPVLGSVVDQARVERVCKHFSVQTIYHAAAYKHVPLVEMNPAVGVINNVMGTLNTAKAAIAAHVETFVLISTDKAVRPTNVMGASKRFAELVLQGLDLHHGKKTRITRFTMVRFGNVLGSSGSVVPFFRSQIKKGGPITVTHKDIIRYFMTIPEAAQLVIQAGALGQGGDVFVLDMGEPVRIYDLATHMIKLSGLDVRDENNPDGDIEIKVTGLRPGEKLYEELLIGDNVSDTTHPRIMRAEEEVIPWEQLQIFIDELNFVDRHNDASKVRDVLLRVVQGYSPQCGIVDVLESKDHNDDKENQQSA
jgi:FlaA1/EpsC-like NDP-sugar epimerase